MGFLFEQKLDRENRMDFYRPYTTLPLAMQN
nr:MAG TPA: hypothetical protein [Caudoviricetes sp.]